MKIIKKITKSMKKRLCLAEYDIDIANQFRDDYPELAKAEYALSVELMNQFRLQHEHIAQIISAYKKEGREVPEAMQAIYDYLHEEYTDWAAEIKAKHELFK